MVTFAKIKKRLKDNWQLYLFLLPPLIYLLIFNYYPMYGAQIAFRRFNYTGGIYGSPWVGFDNFVRFFNNYNFQRTLVNTLTISIYGLLAGFPFPILFALGLNYVKNLRYKKTIQMVSYAPYFISTVVIVGMLLQFLDPRIGIINMIIQRLGFEPLNFMAVPSYFKHIYVWSGVWQGMGWSSIIYIAALSGISPELHEAAIIDGATKLQRIRYIDIPGIIPTASIMLILSLGGILSVGFEKVFLLQNPINRNASEVIYTYIYNAGIIGGSANLSFAAAVGLFQSFVGFILVVIVNFVTRRLSETSLW